MHAQIHSGQHGGTSVAPSPMIAAHQLGRSLSGADAPVRTSDTAWILAALGGATIPCAMLGCMVPGRGNHPRLPPKWSPEQESQYSFANWFRDVLVWSIMTDGDTARKTAAVISQLQASAQEFSRFLPPQTILTGGTINGTPADALTFLTFQLSTRCARLGEEVQFGAVGDLLSLGRGSNERIDTLLTRFESIRMRAAETGGLAAMVDSLGR